MEPRWALLLRDLVLVPLSSHTTARSLLEYFDRKPDLTAGRHFVNHQQRPQRRYETVAPATSLK